MKLLTKTLPDDHNQFWFSCVHTGSSLSSRSGFEKMVHMIHSKYDGCKNNYAVDHGDMIEAITPDDKRFSREQMDEALPSLQRKEAEKMREPIKHVLLAILEGNHERKLWRFGDLTEETCDNLGVDYGTYTAKTTILDKHGNLMYKQFNTHGYSVMRSTADDAIRRESNMRLSLKRKLKFKAGDCAVMGMGHVHRLLVCPPGHELYLTDNGERIDQAYTHWGQTESYIHPDARWFGSAGTFVRLFGDGISGYAERGGYDPTEIGFLILKIRDRKIISLEPFFLDI